MNQKDGEHNDRKRKMDYMPIMEIVFYLLKKLDTAQENDPFTGNPCHVADCCSVYGIPLQIPDKFFQLRPMRYIANDKKYQ